MRKPHDFIKKLKILDGIIMYDGFHIDESIPFEEQWDSYSEDILYILYGERFSLDVGWYPNYNPKGSFMVRAILDQDWLNPVSKKKCRSLKTLKKAIESTVLLINEMKKIQDLPYRGVECEESD